MTAAAVLGGGPSLPEDLTRLPTGCVLIAVNNHALHFVEPDYMVHMDNDFENAPDLASALKTYQGMVISPFANSAMRMPDNAWLDGGFSSTLAVWFALWREYDPVILCGMDCYQGDVKYCHPRPGFYHPVLDYPLEMHLKAWRLAFDRCPHPERIRAASGPLVQLFGEYHG